MRRKWLIHATEVTITLLNPQVLNNICKKIYFILETQNTEIKINIMESAQMFIYEMYTLITINIVE